MCLSGGWKRDKKRERQDNTGPPTAPACKKVIYPYAIPAARVSKSSAAPEVLTDGSGVTEVAAADTSSSASTPPQEGTGAAPAAAETKGIYQENKSLREITEIQLAEGLKRSHYR